VLGCQILIEELMLLLDLYARTRARSAFGTAPTYEARALFMFLLLSDGACTADADVLRPSRRAVSRNIVSSHTPLDSYLHSNHAESESLSHANFAAVFAELAFVNVEFASGQFWMLVAVDFVMLVVRDVRLFALLVHR
jgi:hypothetical protein